ncbi:hypothetical protein CVIRNUC_002903 [Coccomyxa viridis]|uniref:Glycosyltransferase n=1 Tax=Coccomyxa viridis TaxID=1274662 RepID=A0AAV1I1I5_9CHLO|nr:hypothetical protein CVIRNUC_002903 [Coccomyxa viridis]
MRLVFLSLEFSAGTFSGNGIYGRSQVRSLSSLGHAMLVISGKPPSSESSRIQEGAQELIEVELPEWGSLDASSSWQDFAERCSDGDILERVARFAPEAVLGVDWTSFQPYQRLQQGLEGQKAPIPPYVFLNYRVYARSNSDSIILQLEQAAVQASLMTVALSRSDAEYITQHYLPAAAPAPCRPQVLLPALRKDMERLALPACGAAAQGGGRTRRLLLCCMRLSPEKEPQRFVELAEALQARGVLARLGLTPLLCASATGEYAEGLKRRLKLAVPDAIIEERFLGPADLAHIFAATVLNIHSCLYDAFGMTIVEAASQGAPSLVNAGGSVGATDLLLASEGEIIGVDMSQPVGELAAFVDNLLSNKAQLLADVGAAAAHKARSWTEIANAEQLVRLLRDGLTAAGNDAA